MAPCRAMTSPSSAIRSMRGFCNVKRSVVADSRFVPNRSLRIVLLGLRASQVIRRLRWTLHLVFETWPADGACREGSPGGGQPPCALFRHGRPRRNAAANVRGRAAASRGSVVSQGTVLVDVATGIRVRCGIRLDTCDGFVERHSRRQSAVVPVLLRLVRSIFCLHLLTI